MAEKTFPDGIYFNEPRKGAPEFVLGGVSIKTQRFIDFLESQGLDEINLDILRSQKTNKPYLVVNNWKKEDKKVEEKAPGNNDNLPF